MNEEGGAHFFSVTETPHLKIEDLVYCSGLFFVVKINTNFSHYVYSLWRGC